MYQISTSSALVANAGPPTSGATLYRATEISALVTSTKASTTRLIISDIGFWHASAHAASTACETLSR